MYNLIKNLLFKLDPEQSHHLTMKMLQTLYRLKLTSLLANKITNPCEVMGLHFPNPVGLAAGLDKNADYVDALAALGFGFIEIGTVTPKPQTGNPTPRLFRLPEDNAIINRMGFNNKGIEYVAKQLEKTSYQGVLGINIGKNKDTPLENAIEDYVTGFHALWKYASYITINISSPNTPDLRELQQPDMLSDLLLALKQEQKSIKEIYEKYVPLVIKISPDLSEQEVNDLARQFLKFRIDGVIATNTTIQRDDLINNNYAHEKGGLSGRPLSQQSTKVIKQLYAILQNKIPIIASGGVMDSQSALEKFQAGAVLVQIYSGLIYSGPGLIKQLVPLS